MSTTKFTKGEWKVFFKHFHSIRCNDDFTIADINPHVKEAEANAKLIAAAPEMLDALIKIKEYVTRSLLALHDAKQNEVDYILLHVDAAIKKATA